MADVHSVAVAVVIIFVFLCCLWYKPPQPKRQIELLFKRCEQSTTRKVEDKIIHTLKLKGADWTKDLDLGRTTVLVFCVISSRIGRDIERALRGVHETSAVFLVLLHDIPKRDLYGDLSDRVIKVPDERVKGIAHFALAGDPGKLHRSSQNDEGFDKLVELLKESKDVDVVDGHDPKLIKRNAHRMMYASSV